MNNLDLANPSKSRSVGRVSTRELSSDLLAAVEHVAQQIGTVRAGEERLDQEAEFPLVPLGDVLSHRSEFIQIDDETEYKRCRVQVRAQGILLRDNVLGAAIKTKRQQVCRAGDFLVAEIDAKVGGFGIVPAELDGAIVSGHYFLYTIRTDSLDRQYLALLLRTAFFQEQVKAQGSTNYAAIRPAHVLGYRIPLPTLTDQQRIVEEAALLAEIDQELEKARTTAATLSLSAFEQRLGITAR